uniref:Uncharacterized protein n=1 Tax=Strongyloides papillosus TaxID=174720 RepID=A0A0N5B4D8_STREA
MFNFNLIILVFTLGINPIASKITLEEATEIVSKILQPVFEGYKPPLKDTAFQHKPDLLIGYHGYQLRPLKIAMVPQDFHVLLNGGKYDCAKRDIIRLCKLIPVYTFFDGPGTDTYMTNTITERNSYRPKQRTHNRFLGYFSTENGLCGATLNITRLYNKKLPEADADRSLITAEEYDSYKKTGNPNLNDFDMIHNYFHGWRPKTSDINLNIEAYNNLYKQTVDGKPIDRTRVCRGDLADELAIRNDIPLDNEVFPPPLPNIDYVDEDNVKDDDEC